MSTDALRRLANARLPSSALDGEDLDAEIQRILAQPRVADAVACARPARVRRRLVLGAGLSAALVAAAVGVTVVTSGPVERTGPPLSVQDILLAAADHTAAQRTPTTGRFWHRSSVAGNLQHITMDGAEFDVIRGGHYEDYDALDGGPSYDVRWAIGAKPATDRDAAAIRRIGNPDVYRLGPPVAGPSGQDLNALSTENGKRQVTARASSPYPFGGMTLTFAQLAALPTDLAELRTVISTSAHQQNSSFVEAGFFLADMPIRPQVRAAVYTLLSMEPGVRSLGTVTDLQGRKVNAIAWDERMRFPRANRSIPESSGSRAGNGWVEGRALIDPRSGAPLGYEYRVKILPAGAEAWQHTGQLVSYFLNLGTGFTDQGPEGR